MWNKYTLDDIVEIEITDSMLAQAKAEKKFYDENKQGEQTVNLRADHDIVGSLAHQAVEQVFDFSPYTYQSSRQIKFKGGDKCDMIYGERIIDVKHAYGRFNPQYFYNHNCGITKKEWDSRLVSGEIDTFIFVNVDLEAGRCYVLGVITKDDFDNLKEPFNKGVDGYQVKSRQLTSIHKFIYG